MPASRRARAMILAPRSWPSRPGLAISTRILFSGMCALGDGDFFVGAEDVAEGIADFAQSRVGLYRLEDVGHEIFSALRCLAQRSQAARDFVLRAFRTQFAQTLGLAARHGFINL